MSRNGSGIYSLPSGNPVTTGTTISSSWANTTLSDIATALTGSVASDGQTAMTGNLQMGNNKITGLAAATASGQALVYGQNLGAIVGTSVTDSGLTAGRVTYAGTGGLLTDSANLTYDGNSLVVPSLNSNNTFGFKNRIINGAMMIDQRNNGASVTPTDGQYCLDRWRAGASASSKFSVQQSTTAPAGFGFSMLCTSLSAYSVGTNDNFEMFQLIEGFNTADLGWGTANAQTVTLSFQVRSSLTGTFGGSIQNSAFNRSYPFTYTISSANTWETKTVTIAGDTGGTWIGATNGTGVVVCFGLGAGSGRSGTAGSWASATYYNATGATSLVGTNGATFYITGVQLEKGSTATSFDYRPYGTEFSLCQRYYESSVVPVFVNATYANGAYISSGNANIFYKTTKRAAASNSVVYTGNIDNATGAGFIASSDNYTSGLIVSVNINSMTYPYAIAAVTYKANAEL